MGCSYIHNKMTMNWVIPDFAYIAVWNGLLPFLAWVTQAVVDQAWILMAAMTWTWIFADTVSLDSV